MVVAKDGTIYRFSATRSMRLLSATNALRRTLVFACTHQYPLCQFLGAQNSTLKQDSLQFWLGLCQVLYEFTVMINSHR